MKQIRTKTLGAIPWILLAGAAIFLLQSLMFVGVWDLVAVPLFHASPAPYTAGIGVSVLLAMVISVIEVVKERH